MGNLIIKGKGGAGNKLIIQDQAGGAVLTTGDSGATLASTTTFPAGHIVYSQHATLAGTSDTAQPTSWTDSGLQITVAGANVALGSKIFISWNHLVGINQGVSSRQADYRLERTAPSTSTIVYWKYWGLGMNDDNGTEHLRLNASASCMDVSLGSGDHTYKVQFRCSNGDTNHCGAIYYRGYAGTTHSIQAMVVK